MLVHAALQQWLGDLIDVADVQVIAVDSTLTIEISYAERQSPAAGHRAVRRDGDGVMTAAALDRRRQLVQGQNILNGVDYIEVVPPPPNTAATQLRVSFVNPLITLPTPSQVQVSGGDRIPTLNAIAVDPTDDPDTVLVTLAGGGDMSTYTLSLATGPGDPTPPPWVDPMLAAGCFTFALDCLTDVACDDDTPCPPAAVVEPVLDYLARDWTSLRAVLLDRLAVLQPGWTQRDRGRRRVALVEALAEVGDRASYQQDAIATEAYLGTARRRISVRRHARLVDYAMSDGTNARVWVQLAVARRCRAHRRTRRRRAAGRHQVAHRVPRLPVLIPSGTAAETEARSAGALEFQTMHDLLVVSGAHSSMTLLHLVGRSPALPAGATVGDAGRTPPRPRARDRCWCCSRTAIRSASSRRSPTPIPPGGTPVRLVAAVEPSTARPAGRRTDRRADHRDLLAGRRCAALAADRRGRDARRRTAATRSSSTALWRSATSCSPTTGRRGLPVSFGPVPDAGRFDVPIPRTARSPRSPARC